MPPVQPAELSAVGLVAARRLARGDAASTIGANRAGAAAASELLGALGLG